MSLYIGLMSGTSMDAIDAVLCDIKPDKVQFIDAHAVPIPNDLKQRLEHACRPDLSVTDYRYLAREYAALCAEVTLQLLEKANVSSEAITAVASHGQTLWHAPPTQNNAIGYSIQLNDADWLSARIGIPVIFDFRARDLALGGQGAPLVPAFHQFIFADTAQAPIAVVNLGGIANISFLDAQSGTVIGFDTGPANTLLDLWIERHQGQRFDDQGQWAQQGELKLELLSRLLNDPFFSSPPPKSSGREHFNLAWLNSFINDQYHPQDVQRTLVELTAKSIANSFQWLPKCPDKLIVCGGGAFNSFLLERIAQCLPKPIVVADSAEYGVAPQHVEAMAFAWLGWCFDNKKPANLPAVTGASQLAVLGKRVNA
ncbi:anhydro-N-acetylmuramic acid kinase [Idiomarina sp. MD25a]|uniref:anhydro-N-acetylmuramic acid kinase n=1 Tax=Idiomarina sp. MD25a TaxID=1889913 RepID=UPI0008F81867|nr:anhydro-N-acetylmuramic acid kinase [Idiomarina sp. MD25a]OIM98087.1 anhydro-N-acetylmuramic acid kinase [Idiomarina sp. MD25a]